MVWALVVDDVLLGDYLAEMMHELVGAGYDVSLIPTDSLAATGEGWAAGFGELVDTQVLLDASSAATWEGAIVLASTSLLAELERPLASVTDAAAQAVRVARDAGRSVLIVPGWESDGVSQQTSIRVVPATRWLDPSTGTTGDSWAILPGFAGMTLDDLERFDLAWVCPDFWLAP
ncbi:hypothetical protein [Lysinibacter cavernae]|uniref:Uncharacterized protein n=1 Tax=Lysinibacter cavernae TaxID=1640652 RepID=A0A7X5R131_9MICO|nr:hypothetical protein [Lysinibacter cavernae]NIH53653.1 hypothetical protein [Lysinibacter cavernae]